MHRREAKRREEKRRPRREMKQREDKGQRRLDEQQEGEDRVRLLDALGFDLRNARCGGVKGRPSAIQKLMTSEGFANRTLRERRVRQREEKEERGTSDTRERERA